MAKVIILGGGVAGMSAAHELVERGFEVEVYERNEQYAGGKARSVNVPGTNILNPNLFLPGEHGFRFFPGFYQHVTDTMKRIPFKNGKSVFENLTITHSVEIAQTGAKPFINVVNFPSSLSDIKEMVHSLEESREELTHEEKEFFAYRIWQLMSSCPDRFIYEYENIGWWEYCNANNFSDNYRRLLVEGLTRSLVAAKARKASTKTVGAIFLQLIYLMLDYNANDTDRVLNSPTNDAWLNPWLEYLTKSGVKYHKGMPVVGFETSEGKISGALVQNTESNATISIKGDYYILAVPLEKAATLLDQAMIDLDPSLQNIIELAPNVEWMNGIQFYLNKEINLNFGHTIYSNSSWALTSISQLQFWGDYNIADRGNGKVKTILSVDVSSWTTPGNFNNKIAMNCTIDEIKEEVWKQMKMELNTKDQEVLKDEMREFVHLDSDISPVSDIKTNTLYKKILTVSEHEYVQKVTDLEPLLVNQTNTWSLRPNAYTKIPNFYLASDYVKTNTDLATMEGANEAARRAVNCILDAEHKNNYCTIWPLFSPGILKLTQSYDKKRFKKGLDWTPNFPWWIKLITFVWSFFYIINGLIRNFILKRKVSHVKLFAKKT
ncbi:MAG: FAD-dependent oxidoreductase [Saprospiraceae bacterium]|nr:FAD-dependent oxidoreductase [Saprospiraceae bacterium]